MRGRIRPGRSLREKKTERREEGKGAVRVRVCRRRGVRRSSKKRSRQYQGRLSDMIAQISSSALTVDPDSLGS